MSAPPACPVASHKIVEGRYEIIDELGAGGFGTVYSAQQLATGQLVAIKVLRWPDHPAGGLDKRIARFRREMQLCAQMHHPNIVRLIDSGSLPQGFLYLVFEFLPGQNLATILANEGRLETQETCYLMLQVLDALACAHAEGVVHRDLKPANIMIVPTGARRNAIVLDFGVGVLAKDLHLPEQLRITATGEALGTPFYAAPEQLQGQPPTARSDLYAWGLVFLECLTGERVIGGSSIAEVVFKQLSPEPIALPDTLVDHPLGYLLARATTKAPAARDVTAHGLLQELEACALAGLSTGTRIHVPVRNGTAGQMDETLVESRLSKAAPPCTVFPFYPSSRQLIEGERRLVTALCSSISISSVDVAAPDFEFIDETVTNLQQTCINIAEHFEGHVVGMLGRQVLVYFGYPATREDDAERAARAALAIVSAIRERSHAVHVEKGVQVEVRLGLHTGLIIARQLQGLAGGLDQVLGTTATIATAVCELAEPFVILVSIESCRLLREKFTLCPTLEAEASETGPIPRFRLEPRATAPTSTSVEITPFVGREREFQILLGCWNRVRAGTGQGLLITGEPGIGKSRLAGELSRKLHSERHTWLECRCARDSANTTYYPMTQLLEQLVDPATEAEPEARLAALRLLLARYGFELAEALPLLSSLLSLPLLEPSPLLQVPPQKQKEMTINLLLSLLFEMAEEQPLVLVVEDLQWADPSTVELLNQLVSEIALARVYAIFSARPEFNTVWSNSAVFHLQLGRLDEVEVERMVLGLAHGHPLPSELVQQIAGRTEGVPLFVEQLVQMMLETGRMMKQGDRYVLVSALSEFDVPSTLWGLFMARLDRLGPAKETAQIAAALGREFGGDLLAAVSPLSASELEEHLGRLMAAELIQLRRRLKHTMYLFKHALIRDAAYESMPKRSRRQVHARIARILEERFPERGRERPELLAQHHAAAEQKREAIGYALRAGQAALQRSAYMEAMAHTRTALGWLDAIKDERRRSELELELNGVLTPALMATQGFASAEFELVLRRSRKLIDELGDNSQLFPTLWALIQYQTMQNHQEEARALAERFLSLAEKTNDPGRQVAVLATLGTNLFTAGRHAEARQCLERALDLYAPEQHHDHALVYGLDSRAYAHATLSSVLWFLGYPDQSWNHAQAALGWARELDHANTLGSTLFGIACVYHYGRRREQLIEITDVLRSLAERYDIPMVSAYGDLLRAWADSDLEGATRSLGRIETLGLKSALSYWRSLAAEIEASLGQYAAAVRRLDDCLLHAAETCVAFYVPELYRLKGEYLLESEPHSTELAELCLRRASALAGEQGAKLVELRATGALARLLKNQGRADEARIRLNEVFSWFSEGFEVFAYVQAAALQRELEVPSKVGPTFREQA